MKRKPHSRRKRTTTKSVLRLPDLEHAKAAVLNSLTSLDAQRGYRHIDEFVDWYCSEPRRFVHRRARVIRKLLRSQADQGYHRILCDNSIGRQRCMTGMSGAEQHYI
jgi:hypothetical protein